VAHYSLDEKSPIIGNWLRVDFIHNSGGLFGMLQGLAPVLALVTVAVVAILVALEVASGWRSWLMTLTLALLLGGAVGNFVDRIRFGYVVDFVDIGFGTWRLPYIFNIADSAVTISILLMLALWLLAPWLERRDGAEPKETESFDGVASSGSGNGPAVG
jgi:signal peptidase II